MSNFSLGWTVRYRFPFYNHTTRPTDLPQGLSDYAPSKPWFIPGYGGDSRLGFTVSAIWTIPSRKKEQAQPEGVEKSDQSDRSDSSDRSDKMQ